MSEIFQPFVDKSQVVQDGEIFNIGTFDDPIVLKTEGKLKLYGNTRYSSIRFDVLVRGLGEITIFASHLFNSEDELISNKNTEIIPGDRLIFTVKVVKRGNVTFYKGNACLIDRRR